jgi:hypothetical protein
VADLASDVWVHPAVRVRSSPIAGDGLFADEPIGAGTPLIRFGGRVVSTDELHVLFEDAAGRGRYVDTIAIDDDTHLVLPPGTIAHYGNHSCDPSTWLGAAHELVARRDLERGVELTSDYGVMSDDPAFRMDCRCGAPACRRVITGSDWQRADLQVVHRGRWPRGLQRRIDTAGDASG